LATGLGAPDRREWVDLLDAVHHPDAQTRAIDSPFGQVPGSMYARPR
jgi:hypothetical protein